MIIFRKANDNDITLLFKWANDEEVRKNSFNTNKITCKEHAEWFIRKITEENSCILIVEKKGVPIGQIRVELEKGKGIINYSVASEHRGKGYGTEILKNIENYIKKNLRCSHLVGKIKKDNLPSLKAFSRAGFIKQSENDFYVEYEKKSE